MLVSIVPMSIMSSSAAQTENNETSATYNYQANSMYALEMYLKVAGDCNINSGGKAYINDCSLIANGCANMFEGKGVDGGLTISGGSFKLDKHDKIRLSDLIIDEWSTLDGTLYYSIVRNGYCGDLGIPDSEWRTDLKHKRVIVHDHDADKWTSYFGDRESDFEVNLSENQYNEVSIYGNNQFNTEAIFLQGAINGINRILFNHDENYAAFGVRFKCPLGVIFTEESGFEVGCTLEVDIEKMAGLDEELMEAYFNDEVTYKWFYDGRLWFVTKNNSYKIENSTVGHYIAVKVCYGDKSVVSEEFQVKPITNTGLLGDANEDGIINIMDATAIQKHLAGVDTGYPIGEYI